MRLCKCGGHISALELTHSRTRWECKECGWYEIFDQKKYDDQSNEMLDFSEINGETNGQT